jgi:hypothetical protein
MNMNLVYINMPLQYFLMKLKSHWNKLYMALKCHLIVMEEIEVQEHAVMTL